MEWTESDGKRALVSGWLPFRHSAVGNQPCPKIHVIEFVIQAYDLVFNTELFRVIEYVWKRRRIVKTERAVNEQMRYHTLFLDY